MCRTKIKIIKGSSAEIRIGMWIFVTNPMRIPHALRANAGAKSKSIEPPPTSEATRRVCDGW
jgi:hypothetical protein